MALIGPVLDDRTWDQLRTELVERIPAYTPEWTDHNASDPGIALLELFAFLGESLLFRFNQIPDATKVAFLRLLEIAPRPATPATVLAALSTTDSAGVEIPDGTQLTAGAVPFQTDEGILAWPLEVLAAGRIPAPAPPTGTDATPAQQRREQGRRTDAAMRAGLALDAAVTFYETRTLSAGSLDVADTVDNALWIALLDAGTAEPNRLHGKGLHLAVRIDETVDRPFLLEPAEAADFRSDALADPPPSVLWRIWVPDPVAAANDVLRPVEVRGDRTRGLTTTGTVVLGLPEDLDTIARVTQDTLDSAREPVPGPGAPPALDDPETEERVLAWLQLTRPAGEARPIRPVEAVLVNAVAAVQSTTTGPELLGDGDGGSDQLFSLVHQGVLADSVYLEVEELDGWRRWTEVEDFVATRDPDDRHFVLDRADGVVRFPAGGRFGGRVPGIGERVRVRSYRYGGGTAGNVPAEAITAVTGVGGVEVTNPFPAAGGDDPEPLDDALDRIPREVHRRDRAVTDDDYVALASGVAGVARAHALPLFHPDAPADEAAGVVTVVVLPSRDPAHPGAPLPDRALLRRVAAHLDQRRLVTAELYVVPPEYVPIAVAAGIEVRDGYQVDAVRRWVELILRQYLAPVPPYGPEGQGWPFGRTVRAAELHAIAVQVEGVEYLTGLTLAVPDPADPVSWREVGEVDLARYQIPELREITVVPGPPLAPGAEREPQPPVGPEPVLLPLPPEVC